MQKFDPIYRQIEAYLEKLIAQNRTKKDYKLPSENQIAREFGSSRIPAKLALDDLQNRGIIYRLKGKGSYIVQDPDQTPGNRPKTVCLLIPRFGYSFFEDIVTGIQQGMAGHAGQLYIAITDDDAQKEEAALRDAVGQNMDGILIFPVVNHTYNNTLLELTLKGYPVVMIGRSLPGLNLSCVYCDHYLQIYHATQHLIERGHRDIAMLAEAASVASSCAERLLGYRTCMMENFGAAAINQQEVDFFDPAGCEKALDEAIEAVMSRSPTAIISSNNATSRIVRYLRRTDKAITIVTIDRMNFLPVFTPSPIVLDQNPAEIGRLAAEQLYKQMNGEAGVRKILVADRMLEAEAPDAVPGFRP